MAGLEEGEVALNQARVTFKDAFASTGAVSRVAMAMGVLAMVVVAIGAWNLAGALLGPKVVNIPTAEDVRKQATQHDAQFEGFLKLIDARTVFVVPAAPDSKVAVTEEDPNKPPPLPTTYAGPSIVAMVNDEVWFQGGKRLKIGAPAEDGLEIVRTDAPWDAVVRWKGVEFTVPLFKRDTVVFPEPGTVRTELPPLPPPEPKPTPKPEATKPEAPKPAGEVKPAAPEGAPQTPPHDPPGDANPPPPPDPQGVPPAEPPGEGTPPPDDKKPGEPGGAKPISPAQGKAPGVH